MIDFILMFLVNAYNNYTNAVFSLILYFTLLGLIKWQLLLDIATEHTLFCLLSILMHDLSPQPGITEIVAEQPGFKLLVKGPGPPGPAISSRWQGSEEQ